MGGQRHGPAALPARMTSYPLHQEVGRTAGPVWIGAENLALTVIRSPDRLVLSRYGINRKLATVRDFEAKLFWKL